MSKNPFRLDVRTKFLCVIVANVIMFLATSLAFELIIIMLFGVFILLDKKIVLYFKTMTLYLCLVIMYINLLPLLSGFSATLLAIPVSHFRKLYIIILPAILLMSTTSSRELMSGMHKLHLPKAIVIAVSIAIRYFPAFIEDFRSIKDAMKLRRVQGFSQIKYVYLPMLVSSSKLSDEITEAAITRGIENPCEKTCVDAFRMKLVDYVAILMLTGITAFAIYWRLA